jgi:IS30 family transposase
MKFYQQLTLEQRYGIYSLIKTGHTQAEIAQVIGVHKSTISRELRRNRGDRGYRYQQAHRKAIERQTNKIPLRIDKETWSMVEALISEDWSPEQISGWLKLEMNVSVSHEWIYHHILMDKQSGGHLYRHLRCRKKRKKRYGSNDRRGEIRNKISIDRRPAIVDAKERIGDWEIDTIIGKGHKQAVVSATERKSRFALIYKVEQKTSDLVNKAIIKLLLPIKQSVLTVTSDNGKEFAGHEVLSNKLDAEFYFAHPYSSFERGLNENTNGLIRQYFPKDRDFTSITNEEIIRAIKKLNNRPRKCLGFKTPNQVFFEGVNCCT